MSFFSRLMEGIIVFIDILKNGEKSEYITDPEKTDTSSEINESEDQYVIDAQIIESLNISKEELKEIEEAKLYYKDLRKIMSDEEYYSFMFLNYKGWSVTERVKKTKQLLFTPLLFHIVKNAEFKNLIFKGSETLLWTASRIF